MCILRNFKRNLYTIKKTPQKYLDGFKTSLRCFFLEYSNYGGIFFKYSRNLFPTKRLPYILHTCIYWSAICLVCIYVST